MELGVLISNGGARNCERALEALENRMSDTLEAPLFRPPASQAPHRASRDGGLPARRAREPPEHLDGGAFRGSRHRPARGRSGGMTVVNDPAIIRHILVDNAANYRKDDLQIRILAPGPGPGSRDGRGRRMAAPAPHHRAALHAAHMSAASSRPWSRRPIASSGAGSGARTAAWSMPRSK